MKCVGYDWGFEKHLARSLEGLNYPPPSGSVKKRKSVQDDDSANDNEDEEKDTKSEGSDPKRRWITSEKLRE